jgi:hypothetical protein
LLSEICEITTGGIDAASGTTTWWSEIAGRVSLGQSRISQTRTPSRSSIE